MVGGIGVLLPLLVQVCEAEQAYNGGQEISDLLGPELTSPRGRAAMLLPLNKSAGQVMFSWNIPIYHFACTESVSMLESVWSDLGSGWWVFIWSIVLKKKVLLLKPTFSHSSRGLTLRFLLGMSFSKNAKCQKKQCLFCGVETCCDPQWVKAYTWCMTQE